MPWTWPCLLLAALLASVQGDGRHYKDGEKVSCVCVVCCGVIALCYILGFYGTDHSVREQSRPLL